MKETETQFGSTEEAASALRLELGLLRPGPDFSADNVFELAQQAIRLKSGDASFESQKESMLRDLISQKLEFAQKYQATDESGKEKLIESLQKQMENNFLRALERR